jgi:hypothetical protein
VSYGAYICLYFLLCLDTAELTEDDLRFNLFFTSRTEGSLLSRLCTSSFCITTTNTEIANIIVTLMKQSFNN